MSRGTVLGGVWGLLFPVVPKFSSRPATHIHLDLATHLVQRFPVNNVTRLACRGTWDDEPVVELVRSESCAIDDQFDAGDVATFVGREKRRDLGNFVQGSSATEGYVVDGWISGSMITAFTASADSVSPIWKRCERTDI
jgi:hypothetical protein